MGAYQALNKYLADSLQPKQTTQRCLETLVCFMTFSSPYGKDCSGKHRGEVISRSCALETKRNSFSWPMFLKQKLHSLAPGKRNQKEPQPSTRQHSHPHILCRLNVTWLTVYGTESAPPEVTGAWPTDHRRKGTSSWNEAKSGWVSLETVILSKNKFLICWIYIL